MANCTTSDTSSDTDSETDTLDGSYSSDESNVDNIINISNSLKDSGNKSKVLHVIAVISNICEYEIRWKLCKEFLERLAKESEESVTMGLHRNICVVELAYGDQEYHITDTSNKNHLQLRVDVPMWHKENLINIAIEKLLPKDWEYVAWLDTDIEFMNRNWVEDTLNILSNGTSIVQLFKEAHMYNADGTYMSMSSALSIFNSPHSSHSSHSIDTIDKVEVGHPGLAWACTHKFYDAIGGLMDKCILGSADSKMVNALVERYITDTINPYDDYIYEKSLKFAGYKHGFVNGTVKHYYHGDVKNRQYEDRQMILYRYKYDPTTYVTYNNDGLLVPTDEFPYGMIEAIVDYFFSRKED